jgi:hypothetical protein
MRTRTFMHALPGVAGREDGIRLASAAYLAPFVSRIVKLHSASSQLSDKSNSFSALSTPKPHPHLFSHSISHAHSLSHSNQEKPVDNGVSRHAWGNKLAETSPTRVNVSSATSSSDLHEGRTLGQIAETLTPLPHRQDLRRNSSSTSRRAPCNFRK